MVIELVDINLNKMLMEYPAPSLSESGLEESSLMADNDYLKGLFREIRTPLFSITDGSLHCRKDVKIHSCIETNNMLWFCAAIQGSATCYYHPSFGEELWQGGQANLMSYGGVKSYSCYGKDKPFRMISVMLSPAYLVQIVEACPALFGEIRNKYASDPLFRAFPKNIPFCPATREILNGLLNYKWTGNAAPLYLDGKIREILSLFLCQPEGNCHNCNCHSPRDNDKFIHAKKIIEQEYLNPPSLHRLAMMVGTNECTLKNGFKKQFGVTVFGYLFDYRMKTACRYLMNTDKTIQEVGELVGYEYHSHFTTAFKRKFFVSPQEYRRGNIPDL